MVPYDYKLELMRDRLRTLEGTAKNIKCGGVLRKLRRQIRNKERELGL